MTLWTFSISDSVYTAGVESKVAIKRTVYVVRVPVSMIPAAGDLDVQVLYFPAGLTEVLDAEGWRVVSHTTAFPDLSGDMMLSLYCERDA